MKRSQKLAVMLVPTPPYEICGLGSAEFLEGVFKRKKRSLGLKRKVGPRVPRLNGMGSVCTLRDLRGEV